MKKHLNLLIDFLKSLRAPTVTGAAVEVLESKAEEDIAMYEILPKRTMSLGGNRVEAGKTAKVSKEDHDLAVRMGWATSVEKAKKADKAD